MSHKQKSYKKFVATAATATLVASAIVPVASAANFSDVADNNEFKEFIDSLSEKGIINGYETDNTFRPDNKLTRGQVAIMLGRWLEKNGETVPTDWANNPRFSDISSSNEELAKYAALVSDAEVFTGVGGKLNPSQNISRQHMAVVLDRVAEQVAGVSLVELAEEAEDKEVADLEKANADYHDEIQALVNLGISTVSNFRPTEEVTRAHFAKFLYKTIEVIEEVPAAPEAPTAEEIQAEVDSVAGTLPALADVTSTTAATALTTTAAAKAALVEIEEVIEETELTSVEKAGLEAAIAKVEASIDAIEDKATPLALDNAINVAVAALPAVEGINADNAVAAKATATSTTTTLESLKTQVGATDLTDAQKATLNAAIEAGLKQAEAVAEKADAEIEAAKLLAVSSVQVVNAQTIKVNFSKAVDETSATDPANYNLVGAGNVGDSAVSIKEIELEEDGKSVNISLSAPVANETQVALTVEPVTSKANAKEKTARYSTAFQFNDTVKPTYVGFENPVQGEVVVNFSEALDQTTLTTDNVKVYKDGEVVTFGTSEGQVGFTPTEEGFELTNLEDNVEYTVTVVNVKDLAGNLTSPNLVNVKVKSTVAADKVKPVVTDITAAGVDKVVVKVSEELANIATDGEPVKYVEVTGADETVAQVYNKEAGTVTVTLDNDQEATLKTITVSGFKDLAKNEGVAFTKTVNLATPTAAITKTEVVAKANANGTVEDYAKVTFNKDIYVKKAEDTPTPLAARLTTPENVVKTLSIAEAALEQGTGKESNVLYISLDDVDGLEKGKLEIALPKTVVTNLSTTSATATVNYEPKAANAPIVKDGNGVDKAGLVNVVNSRTVRVTFDRAMGQSALDVNNYTIGGANVFEKAIFAGSKEVVELTLKAGSTIETANYDFAISTAVKAENGVALQKAYNETLTLAENVAPTVKSARIVENGAGIELTFSEAVEPGEVADFDVYVAGTKYTETTTEGLTDGEESSTTLTLDLENPLDAEDLAKTITLVAVQGIDIVDAKGNLISVTAPVRVSN